MNTIVIVIAPDEISLVAVAATSDLSIIKDTKQAFDGLDTYSYPTISSIGAIETGKKGWIALATMN